MSLVTSIEQSGGLLNSGAVSRAGRSVSGNSGFQTVLERKLSSSSGDLNTIFEEAASRYNLPVTLLRAVAKTESNFNASAVSPAGAMGVMQLMPNTAKSLGVTDPFDARQNIMGGAKYLSENLNRFGDVKLALAAYNAGPNSVTKYGGIPPYTETQNYVKKVMGYMGGSETELSNQAASAGGLGTSSGSGSSANSLGSLSGLGIFGNYAVSYGSLQLLNSLENLNGLGTYGSGLTGLSGLGSYGSASGLLGGYNSLGSLNSLSGNSNLAMMYAAATSLTAGAKEDEDTITVDKESFYNMIELMRLQMMTGAERQVGISSLL